MKNNKYIILTFIFILWSSAYLIGQDRNLEFAQKITISEGLAHNGVTSILEDSKGFIWIGTYDGLNRYDGYQVKVYKNTIDKELFTSNRVRTLNEDEKGNIWIGTDEGISVYNYEKEVYLNIYSNKTQNEGINGPTVRKIIIVEDENLILCATEENGILVFNDDFSLQQQYLPPVEFSDKGIVFFDGLELDNNSFVFATSIGLIQFNRSDGIFTKVLPGNISFANSIEDIGDDKFLVSKTQGFAIVGHEKGYNYNFEREELLNYSFNSSAVDKRGKLWLGTVNEGIVQIDDVNALKFNLPLEKSTFTIPSDKLRIGCITVTENKGCWVGTFNDGIFRFELEEKVFSSYNTRMGSEYGLRSNHISSIAPLDSNRFFVTANSGGIALFNTKAHSFESLPYNFPTYDNLEVGAIYIDSKKNTWLNITSGLGLSRILSGKRTIKKIFLKEQPEITSINPRTFTEDKDGNIWMGTTNNVYKVSVKSDGSITKIESLNDNSIFVKKNISLVRKIYADPLFDFIWIGTDTEGLFRVELQNDLSLEKLKVNQYLNDKNNKKSISSDFVTSILRLSNREMWIGTEGGGICKVLDSDTNPNFVSYSEKNGLSNNVVKSIVNDDENNLWITTNIGLNKFNTSDLRFRILDKEDGLPFEDFVYSSSSMDNGNFIFAGLDGFTYFDPKKLKDQEVLPNLEFGDIKISGVVILPGDTIGNRILLDRRLKDGDEIALKYNENIFSIEVTSLHFSTTRNHFIKYKLNPINSDWVEIPSNQKNISFSGLPPGNYELSVMASNSLNQWTDSKKLNIVINPPYWKTIWAYFLYAAFLLIGISTAMYFFLRIQKLNHSLEIDQLEIDKIKEINSAKLRFFSNISHEIKTPLTLISGPVEILSQKLKGNFDLRGKLEIIKRQSKHISRLINQVQDFQKSEANLLKINYSSFSFDSFIHTLSADFEFLAEMEKKKLLIEKTEKPIYVSADKDKLEKVINNVLNNAFKNTEPQDTIKVKYIQQKGDLVIYVSDTGKGIDDEDLPHIFKRFYQSHLKEKSHLGGSGIGLAFSKRLVEMHYGYIDVVSEFGKGTTFKIKLPIIIDDATENKEDITKKILLEEEKFDFETIVIEETALTKINTEKEFANSLIYYAEDNPDMRNFVSEILSTFFKVKVFENGQLCIDAMENEWPDIVISDVLMPQLTGLELCESVKSDIKTSHIPIILLTACTTIDNRIEGINIGADAYLSKPFNIQHLISSIESLLRNRKQLRERFQIDLPLTLTKGKDNSKDHAFLEKLYILMAENLDNNNLNLDGFAKELYLNRTHFYQKVKALTNQTPYELLKIFRLKKATEYLIQDYSVKEVYMMTGFKSRTHFSKLFKEKYGVSPGKYVATSLEKITTK